MIIIGWHGSRESFFEEVVIQYNEKLEDFVVDSVSHANNENDAP
jgi:hypothetical protein